MKQVEWVLLKKIVCIISFLVNKGFLLCVLCMSFSFCTSDASGNIWMSENRVVSKIISGSISAGISTVTAAGLLTIVKATVPAWLISRLRLTKNDTTFNLGNNISLVDIEERQLSKDDLRKRSVSAVHMGSCILSIILSVCVVDLIDKHVQLKKLKIVTKEEWKKESNGEIQAACGLLGALGVFLLDHIYNPV